MIDTQIGYEVLPATLAHSPEAARRHLRNTNEPAAACADRRGRRADEKLEENGKVCGE